MKKIIFIIFLLVSTLTSIISCSKKDNTTTPHSINGLWIGTYNTPLNENVPYFFSFSVYPDGSLSYKSKGKENTTFYAHGTWLLDGSTFSFSVVETSTGNVQTGTAIYNEQNESLASGTLSDSEAGTSATWTMSKVK